MSLRLSGWRLVSTLTLLLFQTALAGALGFIANLGFEERARFERQLATYPDGNYAEAAGTRISVETGGMFLGALAALGIGGAVLFSLAKLSDAAKIRTVQRIVGRSCFLAAFLFVGLAIMTPRVGSPHGDMFPGLGHYISAVLVGVAGIAAMGISRVAKTPV